RAKRTKSSGSLTAGSYLPSGPSGFFPGTCTVPGTWTSTENRPARSEGGSMRRSYARARGGGAETGPSYHLASRGSLRGRARHRSAPSCMAEGCETPPSRLCSLPRVPRETHDARVRADRLRRAELRVDRRGRRDELRARRPGALARGAGPARLLGDLVRTLQDP